LTNLAVEVGKVRALVGNWVWAAVGCLFGFLVGFLAGLFSTGRTPLRLAILAAGLATAAFYACDPRQARLDLAACLLRYALVVAIASVLLLLGRFVERRWLAGGQTRPGAADFPSAG
jgi:NADH:ubiquinone oxidoreductase subunit H